MKSAVIAAVAIISATIGSVQAGEATLQWCVTLHKQFLSGMARKIYALPNAVVCETSEALTFYLEHHEGGDDEETAKPKFVASPEGSRCRLEKQDTPFALMKGKTEEKVGGAMSVLMPPKQRFPMTIRVRQPGDSKVLFASNRDWEFFISSEKSEMVYKLAQCCRLVKQPDCLTVPR
jgi:hypothetical protein